MGLTQVENWIMQLTNRFGFILFLLVFGATMSATGQNISITISPEEIPLNQPLRISIVAENSAIESYKGFPEIEGFRKRGSISNTSTQISNGNLSTTQSISMRYFAKKEGTFRIPSFEMTINGQTYQVAGRTVKVGPEHTASRQKNDPFGSNLFDNFLFPEDNDKVEYVEVEDDAFLAVTTDKDEVYIGEGVNVTVAFYRAETNRAPFDFYKHNEQIAEIRKQIRPASAWEEDFQITNHYPQRVNIGGKRYIQTKLYQATFYPLTLDPIEIPSVDLEMIKYKVARNPTFLGRNKQVDFKTFSSQARTVRVKPLPPHPLAEVVPVGDFQLQERIYQDQLETGKSTYYNFRIVGEGNIATVKQPSTPNTTAFEIFDPIEQRDVSRSGNKVAGQATFAYFITPKEPGVYPFSEYFQWIFFNPKVGVYDTLRSNVVVRVTGDPVVEGGGEIATTGLFYDRIAEEDNTLQSRNREIWWQIVGNVLILAVLGVTAVLVFKKQA